MAIIKTEVDTNVDKQVTGKGIDYIAKELENIRSDYKKQINNVFRILGIDPNDEVANLNESNLSLAQNIETVNESLLSGIGSQTIKSFTTGQQSVFTWTTGTNNIHNLATGVSFDLLSGANIVQMYWKLDGQWVLFTPMGEDFATSYGMGLVFTSSTIKLVYRSHDGHMPIRINGDTEQLDDATHYKLDVININ